MPDSAVVTPAPAAPAAPPISAPAPAAAPPTVNDASAALAWADSSLAPPVAPADASPAPAPVVPAPTDSPGSPASDGALRSDIPRPRFDEVNTRMQRAEQALTQYRRFADFSPDELGTIADLAQGLKTDAPGTLGTLVERVLARPDLAPALAARLAPHAERLRPAQPAPDPEPTPDLQAQDGTLVYSAPQQQAWQEWHTRRLTQQLRAEMQQQVAPLQRAAQAVAQERAQSAYTATTTQVIAALTEADPEFAAHKADVSAVLQADPTLLALAVGSRGQAPQPAMALELAWNRVYRTQVLPQRTAQAEAGVIQKLQQRAVAGSLNPASATTADPAATLGDAYAALAHASRVLETP